MITAARWYDPQPDLSQLYQGDVIGDIPFPTFPVVFDAQKQAIWPILRPLDGTSLAEFLKRLPAKGLVARAAKEVTDIWSIPEGEHVVTSFRKTDVIIVSRSCSLDNPKRKQFLAAPVTAIESLPPEQASAGKLDDLRNNYIPHLFYLPGTDRLKESYADFLRIVHLHRSFFPAATLDGVLKCRLSSAGMAALQHQLSEHFGRQFGFDNEDVCPQEGRYACSNCFHSAGLLVVDEFPAGSPFGDCKGCGDEAAWIKLP